MRSVLYLTFLLAGVSQACLPACLPTEPTAAPTIAAPTTAAPTTATPTTKPPTAGVACDLRCWGTFTGNYLLNGLPATCSLGICTSTDGSNLCRALGYPCGTPTVATTTAAPTTAAPTTTAPICNLRCINSSLNGIYLINGIQSTCYYGKCSATNGSDLCKQIGYPCGV